MTQQHPITPPPELVEQWFFSAKVMPVDQWVTDVATQAAQWGADQELEACCEWLCTLESNVAVNTDRRLRIARRPKPPSPKNAALEALAEERGDMRFTNYQVIRSALESIPND